MAKFSLLTSLYIFLFFNLYAQEVKIFSWNLESGGNDPQYISKRISDLSGYDLFGLCEVDPDNILQYIQAAGTTFKAVLGTTGRNDRLVIFYNQDKFNLKDTLQLHYCNIDGTVRSPLIATLQDKRSGTIFKFMVNHLARGDKKDGRENRRYIQSQLLASWFSMQNLPVIAVGDYNYDLDIYDSDHDPSFDAFTYGNHVHWLYPEEFVRTHCNESYDAAILDFAFINRLAFKLNPKCKILIHEDDCLFPEKNSDHRPVQISLRLL